MTLAEGAAAWTDPETTQPLCERLAERQFVSCGKVAGVRAPHAALAAAPNLVCWLAFAVFAGLIALSGFAGATALSAPVVGSHRVEIRRVSSVSPVANTCSI